MRHVGNFNPEWGYLAPAPSLLRTARVFVVAVVIGATASAAVVFSLMDRPTAEPSVAARTLVLSADPSQADAQAMRQQTVHSARGVQTPISESPGQSHPNIAVAAHASTAPAAESAAPQTPQRPTAAAGLVEAPAITAAEPPPLQALVRENPAAPTAAEAAPASPPTPALKGGIKKPRAVARAAVPPRYDVPRYAAPRFEPRHEAMQRGPYAFLRQYGSFGQEY
jgi:hypothetical protein